MSCKRSQVIVLLEKIAEEMLDERDKQIIKEYIEKLKKSAWVEVYSSLF